MLKSNNINKKNIKLLRQYKTTVPVQTMKAYTGRDTVPLMLDISVRQKLVVNITTHSLNPQERTLVPTDYEATWVTEPARCFRRRKTPLAPPRIWTPGHPAQSLVSIPPTLSCFLHIMVLTSCCQQKFMTTSSRAAYMLSWINNK